MSARCDASLCLVLCFIVFHVHEFPLFFWLRVDFFTVFILFQVMKTDTILHRSLCTIITPSFTTSFAFWLHIRSVSFAMRCASTCSPSINVSVESIFLSFMAKSVSFYLRDNAFHFSTFHQWIPVVDVHYCRTSNFAEETRQDRQLSCFDSALHLLSSFQRSIQDMCRNHSWSNYFSRQQDAPIFLLRPVWTIRSNVIPKAFRSETSGFILCGRPFVYTEMIQHPLA